MIVALEWLRIFSLPIAGVITLVLCVLVGGSEVFDRVIEPWVDEEGEEGQEEADPGLPWSDPESRPLDDVDFAWWEAEFGQHRYDLDE